MRTPHLDSYRTSIFMWTWEQQQKDEGSNKSHHITINKYKR
jgi:hypothetical protein